jgi:hypothetical protein
MALASGDDYKAPLVAFWHKGLGRVGAITYPMAGDYSVFAMNWQGYGDFAQTLARWLLGERQVQGLSYEAALLGSRLDVDLFHSEEWATRFSRQAPRLMIRTAEGVEEILWERVRPGQYDARRSLKANVPVMGALQVGDEAFSIGPLYWGSDEEWQFDPVRIRELKQLSRVSNGQSLVSLADAWQHPPYFQSVSLRVWLTLALLVLFLLDVAQTRLGFAWFRSRQRAR